MSETESSSRDTAGARKQRQRLSDETPIIGGFTLQKRLGTGGQGAVFSAYQQKLDRQVALKLMHGGREDEQQLLREAQNASKVVHPNVVTIYGVDVFDEQVYISMEYAHGGSLRTWVTAAPRTVSEITQRFVEAGRGLSAIHAKELVHRDFKPDNVLLKENGSAVVADFGLSRTQDDAAESRSGTRHFMAPELRGGGIATAASDQYAFCVSLFWALTRTYPQEGADFPPEVPAWLRAIISRGMERRALDRYPSMDPLIADLENTPEVQRRALVRTLALVTGVGALLAAGLIVKFSESPAERALRECTERVESTRESLWSPRLIDKIQKNFASLAGTVGTQTFERVRQRVDPQVDAWAKASTAACSIKEPVARRNTESCLQERRAILAALTDYLSGATDPTMVKDVIRTLSRELKPVETCAQTTGTIDRQETDEERTLRASLATAFVKRAAGKTREALAVANEVAQRSERTPRVRAEASVLAAQLMAELGDSVTAQKMVSAIDLAEASGADELRARGWISLMGFHARRLEFPQAAEAEKRATSIVERLGRPPLLMAPLLNERGNFEFARDRLPAANAIFIELRQMLLATYEPGDPAVLHATNNVLLSGNAQDQVAGFEELLRLTERELGENHPETLFTRHNLAAALLNNGQCGLADANVTDIIATRTAGGVHLQLALAGDFALRARIKACLGRLPEAIADQEENRRRIERSASDNQMHLELEYLYGLKKQAKRSAAELEELIRAICALGFGPPDGTECLVSK